MIEPLKNHPIVDRYGVQYGFSEPSPAEMQEKINEIIEYLNKKEEDNENL